MRPAGKNSTNQGHINRGRRIGLTLNLIVGIVGIIALCVLFIPAAAVTVMATARVRRSDPPAATVQTIPREIAIWFSDPIYDGSTVDVLDAEFNSMLTTPAVIDPNDSTLLRAPLRALVAGRYTVRWQVITYGSITSVGDYAFTVSPPADETLDLVLKGAGVVSLAALLVGSVGIVIWRVRRR